MRAISVHGSEFRDHKGRTLLLRGLNFSGDSKLPSTPDIPSHRGDHFWDTDNLSFVGRPVALVDADEHLARIVSWGYNTIRFVITWEAVESRGP